MTRISGSRSSRNKFMENGSEEFSTSVSSNSKILKGRKRKNIPSCDKQHKGDLSAQGLLQEHAPNKYVWTLNLSKLPDRGHFCSSPPFPFATSMWHLLIMRKKNVKQTFVLALEREDLSEKNQMFHWRLSLLRDDSTVIVSDDGEQHFDCTNSLNHGLKIDGCELEKASSDCLIVDCELRLKGDQESARKSSKIARILRTDALSKDFNELLRSGDASDVTIRVKGKEFKVHRAILGARTPVFYSMFQHDMVEKTSGVVDIDDCHPDTFRAFLNYVYSGMVEDVSPEEALRLYGVAHKYQLQILQEDCLAIIRQSLSVKNFFDIISLAHKYTEKSLLKLARKFFVKNSKYITLTWEWQRFMRDNYIQANDLIIKALGASEP